MLKILRHVELKRVLKSIVDLDSVPGLHVIRDSRQVESEHRWQSVEHGALGLRGRLLTNRAVHSLDFVGLEVVVKTLVDTLNALDV